MSDVPFFDGGVFDVGGDAAQVERVIQVEVVAVAFVDDCLWHAVVDAHRKVLADDDELDCVEVTVIDLAIAEHRWYGIVSNIEGHPDSTTEHLVRKCDSKICTVIFINKIILYPYYKQIVYII